MNIKANTARNTPSLLPHQTAFIERFFADPSVRGHLLKSDIGLGMSLMLAHLIRDTVETTANARILVLVSKYLELQVADMLDEVGVPVEVVDRFRYRVLQDAATGENSVWRVDAVNLLSIDFAKQEDITQSICSVPWTLLVVEDAYLLRGQREQVVRQIVEASPDMRVVLTTTIGAQAVPEFGLRPFETTVWHRSKVADSSGQYLFTQLPTQVEVVEFEKEPSEWRIHETVASIGQQLKGTVNSAPLLNAIMVRSLMSSPAALEENVRRLRNRLVHGMYDQLAAGDDEDEETDTDNLPEVPSEYRDEIIDALNSCLAELEALSEDSKLKAFFDKMNTMLVDESVLRKICVVTDYRATLGYLQAQLEEITANLSVLHGAILPEERISNVRRFRQEGGVLLATTTMMTRVPGLGQVDSLVFYDLPQSPQRLQQIHGLFQTADRTVPLDIVILCDVRTGDRLRGLFARALEPSTYEENDSR